VNGYAVPYHAGNLSGNEATVAKCRVRFHAQQTTDFLLYSVYQFCKCILLRLQIFQVAIGKSGPIFVRTIVVTDRAGATKCSHMNVGNPMRPGFFPECSFGKAFFATGW
jgi:hypothetical protein